MNEQYYLFLDDMRSPSNVSWIELPLVNWTIVKTYKEFVSIIEQKGLPRIISLDNDLCDEHYDEYNWVHNTMNMNFGKIDYSRFKEKCGYHCALFLVDYCKKKKLALPEVYIHTMNDIAAEDIRKVLSIKL